ncbi:MAG: trypsin-like peptidase domain-containing protein, partial [Chlamydiota bacterium]
SPFNVLPLGNSDTVVLGEKLVILGFPSQYANSNLSMDLRDTLTLSQGADSGWDYIFDPDWGMIKTDAAIHEGNSCGPVFGTDNKVIGIATALGVQTDIGLIGPINIMYLLAKQDTGVFDGLTKRGLTKPRKEGLLKMVNGKPQKLPFDPKNYINPLTHQPVKSSVKKP